jgi:preprotein translocase subunit SecD
MFMLRLLLLACVCGYSPVFAETQAAAKTTRVVFQVPGDQRKPAKLTGSDKQLIRTRLEHYLAEMTLKAESISWEKNNDLAVVLPPMGEVVRATAITKLKNMPLLKRGMLSLHHVHPESRDLIAVGKFTVIPGYKLMILEDEDDDGKPTKEKLLVNKRVILDSNNISHAQELYGPHEGKISVKLNKQGAEKMFQATKVMTHGVDRIAIVLDDKVMSAPVVQDTLGANFEISGMKDAASAKEIAAALLAPIQKSLTIKSINPPLAK